MTIYGYIVVDTENCPESYVRLYIDKQKCIDEAYKEYVLDWEMCSDEYGFDNGVDDFGNPMMTKEEFLEDFKENSEAVIQNPHSHLSYHYFKKEVEA